jgi:uncharacterized protein
MATHVFHSWLNPKLRVDTSRIHGKGVFAHEGVKRRERLAIFGGDVMLIDEIDALPERMQEYPMQIEERFVLGSRQSKAPEDTDYFNHSCDPNAGFKGQVFLVAMRDIKEGEEVTFDYAMVLSKSVGSETQFEMECSCGARSCRREITEDDWKLDQLQSRYKGYFSEYLEEKIEVLRAKQSNKRRVAISLYDGAHAEIHHFVEQANLAQPQIEFGHFLLPQQQETTFTKDRVRGDVACRSAFAVKRKQRLGPEDLLIVVTGANLADEADDEYFTLSASDYSALGQKCPGAGVVSLYYMNPKSAFSREFARTWGALSDPEQGPLLSDSVLLLLLESVVVHLGSLETHDECRGCVMDYCQTPSELIEALGHDFQFCSECTWRLKNSDTGAALIRIAERLSERRYRSLRQRTVFLSYAWQDKDCVVAVDQWLRNRDIATRIDQRDFIPGRPIDDEILRVVQQCRVVVVFYSEHSKDRAYPMFERLWARGLRVEGKARVIYFCLDDTPLPGDVESSHIAVKAKAKPFEPACQELLSGILELGRPAQDVDLSQYTKTPPWR